MTRDEMVKRLYIRNISTWNTAINRFHEPDEVLWAAEAEADYFFRNYKPKKKREVFLVPHSSLQQIDCTDAPTHVVFKNDSIRLVAKIVEALRAGKSVRMK